MRSLLKMTWVELKLFAREPLTMVFSLGFPVLVLFVLAEVFGSTPDQGEPAWRGVAPTEYYLPAYVGLTIASMGLLALPVHLAAYREHGVLRRLRASSVPASTVFGSQVLACLAIVAAGSALLVILSTAVYGTRLPESVAGAAAAFLLGSLAFLALGVLLGALLPTARAAQGAGLMLFFVMMFLSGAGPPRGVLSQPLRSISDFVPLTHVVLLLQDPWLGFGWSALASVIAAGLLVGSAGLSLRFFRWE